MRVCLIAAMGENRVIGKGGRLPWRLPADLRFFRQTTWGRPVIMGRVTWDSVGRPLPGRRNIVVSRRRDFAPKGAEVAASLEAALLLVADEPEVFVVGGAQLYATALPRADRIYLTVIHQNFEGDTWFPKFEGPSWRLVSRDDREADSENPYPFSFLVYERVSGAE